MTLGIEREVKLDVDEGFQIPDLSDLLGLTVITKPDVELEAVYYDTADLRLTNVGASFRFRSANGDGGTWTVKLPGDGVFDGLSRHEIDFPGGAGGPPEAAVSVVRAVTRSEPLVELASLRTTRRRHLLVRPDSHDELAEIDDDHVEFQTFDGRVGRFDEVEVELADGASPEVQAQVVEALRRAGARRGRNSPKVARALSFTKPGRSGKGMPASDTEAGALVSHSIAASVERLVLHDPLVRLDGAPEAVHQARVATRRLRSDIKTIEDLIDDGWGRSSRESLQELAALLGSVRDADVLGDRLAAMEELLPAEDRPSVHAFSQVLGQEREVARASLLSFMDSPGYIAMLDELSDVARHPPLRKPHQPAAKALHPLVSRRWRQLDAAVAGLPQQPSDGDLHRLRIETKRCRYAMELASPALGRPASRLAAALAVLQTKLGELQDAVVSEAWLRRASASADPATALSGGLLVALELQRQAKARATWMRPWSTITDKGLADWLAG